MKKLSRNLTLICVLVMIITLFLPYASATERWWGEEAQRDMSMAEFLIYFLGDNSGWSDMYIPVMVVMGTMGLFLLLMLLFVLIKKPIPIIVFDVLLAGVFMLHNWIYTKTRIIGYGYEFSIAYYLFFALIVLTLAGAIWMIVARAVNKPVQAGNEVA